ncbi:CRISPR-associated endoribonuclease Cas6 [Rubeoparvulum massiliense]|uniref:CRISPR-associated endoribonuclease Cas6 n=1 Tax=Rubeoparvulum massiliense TaxID=1631346 RepID=UPI00065E7BCB|nr:CRISPR-associated endoribonuclease Cas6 [Rubeoparvulum massiliense]
MRLKITFRPQHGQLTLPIHYHEIVQGFFYRSIQDFDLAHFLHEIGFVYEKRVYKLFTFSRLEGSYRILKKEKQIQFLERVELSISCVVNELIEDLSNRFVLGQNLQLWGQPIIIEEVATSQLTALEQDKYEIRMLSPLTIYSTFENVEGVQKTQFISPFDSHFSDMIEQNFYKKYMAYYHRQPDGRMKITPQKVTMKDRVVTKYKNLYLTGWMGQYTIESSFDTLQFLYDVGIGAKNPQGFGMFEIL